DQKGLADIEHHMRHFLENHDEQRIASPEFVGNAQMGKPAMVVSATIGTSPTMIYFGQEVGEPGAEDAGLGTPSRTSMFAYVGLPNHQKWMNNKKFDGCQLSQKEKGLRDFYQRLLNFTIQSDALMGEYQEIHFFNKDNTENYDHRVLSYVRWSDREQLIVVTNFDAHKSYAFELKLPQDLIAKWELEEGQYPLQEMLYGKVEKELFVKDGQGKVHLELEPLQSYIFKVEG